MGGGQNSTFSEYGHVAYQIKGNDTCSNMVAKTLTVNTPSASGVGSKSQNIFFLKVVMLHIKLKGLDHYEHHTNTCSILTHTLDPG